MMENWLDLNATEIHQNYQQLQMPQAAYQGVMLLSREGCKASLFRMEEWMPPSLAFLKILLLSGSKPAVLMGVYVQPASKKKQMVQLDVIVLRELVLNSFAVTMISPRTSRTFKS